ncbi:MULTISPECIES: ribosome-associated ATPase/putative transporter RbbA [unclassified Pseudomonas]|uniref:ribosome-associated ATPase/putative transporter RbbA n=1 Tax=unclassified Pseudomonas TaxID=196821 RepID=UPI000D3BB8AA|nr:MULTISPECIES: ribosome-associated ATPase/putative transporter RbbA [unclassified Pseudomonas]RAU42268.1 ATP-binding cassette domain-containing protein [Pseudomonas sp. RIT 409]RAU55083.1 ATP-binding cassette domain-containing protein [Pseudomonas sp. RIT 412]
MTGPSLSIQGLSHCYGSVPALTAVNLELPVGTRCGLIGPDGAGKSTLLALIAGVRSLQTGQLSVLGGEINDRAHRSTLYTRIAFMPQGLGNNLYPDLSVEENVRYFAALFSLSSDQIHERVQTLLLATDLLRFQDRRAGKLSGGMKQKLGLCCALIHDPELLILDEPTTGVDPLSRRHFWELIEQVRLQRPHLTILVATAYMEEAEQFEHCLMLDQGRLIAAGSRAALAASTPSGKLDHAFTHFQGRTPRIAPAPQVLESQQSDKHIIAIEARALTLRFGDFTAVDNVSFSIGKGEIFGFLGSNGCGKTSTMKVLTGLIPATTGTATLLGKPVDASDLHTRQRIGFMTQSFSLYGELTARQNLALHARLYDVPADEREQRITRLLDRFDLTDIADQPSGSLPLGIRQRLSLAVAILHEPEVLILDEPTSGVDPAARDTFWQALTELSRHQGVTIFLSTHFMNEAQRCDRISFMHAGKVLACGTCAQLQEQYGSQTLELAFINCLEQAQAEQSPAPIADFSFAAPVSHAPMTHRYAPISRMLAVAGKERRELLRDRVRLAFALLGAILMMVIFGLGISLDVENLAFAAFDQDQTAESRAYLEAFRGSRYFSEHASIRNPAELHQRLQSSEIELALEIPPGFGRDLYANRHPAVAAWLEGGMPFRAETSRNYVEAVHAANLQQMARLSSHPASATPDAQLQMRFRYNQDVVSVNAIGPGVMALILAFIPAMLTALGIVREKELGSITNFFATPLTRVEFLFGKQLPYIAVSLVNLCLLTAMNRWVFGVPFKGSLLTLALGGILYVMATTSLGLLISAFTRTQIAAILGTMIITSLPTIQFSGLIVPRSSLQGASAVMGALFPAGYFLDIAVGTFTKALDLRHLWPECVALLGFFVTFSGVSLLMLKKQEH